jgi:pimeloyl-ACP methyl ester carboxylesterase
MKRSKAMTAVEELTEDGTSRWIQAGGMNIHYHDIGRGDPLFMMHSVGPGAFTAWITFCKNLPILAQHFRCIAMDLPNFAKTGPIVYNEPVHLLQANTALALMDALGIEQADFLGTSQGGQSAMVFAAHYPERVKKLVFGACHIVTGGDTYLIANKRLPQRGAADVSHASIRDAMMEQVHDQSLVTDELVDYLYRMATGRPDLAEARRHSTSTYYDHGPEVSHIRAPSLIIWGRQDRLCPFEVGIKSLNHLANSRLVVINNCGHWPGYEKPDEYNAHVLNFLKADWASR